MTQIVRIYADFLFDGSAKIYDPPLRLHQCHQCAIGGAKVFMKMPSLANEGFLLPSNHRRRPLLLFWSVVQKLRARGRAFWNVRLVRSAIRFH